MPIEKFRKSLESTKVVKRNGYDYVVHPATDGIPRMDADILREIVYEMAKIGNFDRCDIIIAPEAIGIIFAAPLTLITGKPFNVIRKRGYGLPGEIALKQITGYSQSEMFINGVSKGDRVVIVDDIISTGGTMKAIVSALRTIGAEVVDIMVVIEKGDQKESIEKEIGLKIKTLVKIEVHDGNVKTI